ncbi:lipopolysaccharide-induced tumor necrosis factor-alpha factor homolog [Drosophila innubila]|uniref:lipopolysaccharide-induced tumor necrosis factor-alpha factor homolog n=1 Tax=Drosophila innubila TaxID=198719 RepID=UPI00148D1434|nr:lipopolysaccharide-induced tumor necrosis factor-alpha factor homolog [Drosophila innubila]
MEKTLDINNQPGMHSTRQCQEDPQTGIFEMRQIPMLSEPPSYEQATNVATHVHTIPPATQVIVIQQQPLPAVGPDPCLISCPHCQVQKLTRVEYAPSTRTHCMAALLCIVGLWCFACLPYCATSCMTANHFCGNCNKFVGAYSSD